MRQRGAGCGPLNAAPGVVMWSALFARGHRSPRGLWEANTVASVSGESARFGVIPRDDCGVSGRGLQCLMATEGSSTFVAIVDDDDLMRGALQGLLKEAGLPTRVFASAEDFLKSGQQHHTACLIADIRMPGMSGLDLQARLNADRIRIPTIFITAHGDARMRMQALRAGAVEFLAKPFDDEVLLDSVRAALES